MRIPGFLALTVAFGLELAPASVLAQADTSPVEALAAKLPKDVGDAARKWLHDEAKEQKAMAAFSPQQLEQEVMVALASEPAAADFVLGKMPAETPSTDLLVLHVIGFDAFWAEHAGTREALQKLAESTPDNDLMLACIDIERRLEAKNLRKVIAGRIDLARKAGDAKALEGLAAADERWMLIERGASMPAFMRKPPAVFQVGEASPSIRVVGMGDFGSGSQSQRDVAAAIVTIGKTHPFNIGITFGDNFYPSGMTGTDDPRWRDWWEALYAPLGITFYPTLGNHEWYSDDGAAAELAYKSPTWRFPSPYYTFTAGPVQFFAVDTTEISEAQVLWLDHAIAASPARWKVVYGHHPIFAPERNAKAGSYMSYMQSRLWPILKGRVDAYLCGHQHAMAHMGPQDGVHFFMSGGGGAPLGKVAKKAPGALFAESRFGFLTLDADAAQMRIGIYDTDGKLFDGETISK